VAESQPIRTLVFTVILSTVACGAAAIAAWDAHRRREALLWLAVVATIAVVSKERPAGGLSPDTTAIAQWAEHATWGSSVFAFPDAGKDLYPGVFRAQSKRALWVDWKSGDAVPYSETLALDWQSRWEQSMASPFTAAKLPGLLAKPIDYLVLRRRDRLPGVKLAFEDANLLVYDVGDLRNGILRAPAGR
jgi:hypothetical protein